MVYLTAFVKTTKTYNKNNTCYDKSIQLALNDINQIFLRVLVHLIHKNEHEKTNGSAENASEDKLGALKGVKFKLEQNETKLKKIIWKNKFKNRASSNKKRLALNLLNQAKILLQNAGAVESVTHQHY